MGRRVEKVIQEVEVATLFCDSCGSTEKMARYSENRRCGRCGREVCFACQYIADGEFDYGTQCKHCHGLEAIYLAPLNAAYREIERINREWKEESLKAGKRDV